MLSSKYFILLENYLKCEMSHSVFFFGPQISIFASECIQEKELASLANVVKCDFLTYFPTL